MTVLGILCIVLAVELVLGFLTLLFADSLGDWVVMMVGLNLLLAVIAAAAALLYLGTWLIG